MKNFGNYQYVEGTPMNKRDKQEVGSKFWNKGKWDNFVLPFLPDDCSGMTFVDMGCNAGVFLELAEKKGFKHVVGIDSNKEAIQKAIAYRERIGGTYDIHRLYMERALKHIPVSDYIVFAMAHYYYSIDVWMKTVDVLMAKTRNVIIVTANKREKLAKAGATTEEIRECFKLWEEVGYIPPLPKEGDPFPREQWSFCFKSPFLERVPLDELDSGNRMQNNFYAELDKGVDPLETRYYRRMLDYRKNGKKFFAATWPREEVKVYMRQRKDLYESMKRKGQLEPLTVSPNGRLRDGNHRHAILDHLGRDSAIVRRI